MLTIIIKLHYLPSGKLSSIGEKDYVNLPNTSKAFTDSGIQPVVGDSIEAIKLATYDRDIFEGDEFPPKFLKVTYREVNFHDHIITVYTEAKK